MNQPRRTETTPKESVDFLRLNESIALNIERILDYFNIDYITYPNRVSLSCPIHNSDRPESLNVFTSGNQSIGNFMCWTNHCEADVGRGAINLIRKIMENKAGGPVGMRQVISKIEHITGVTCPIEVAVSKDVRCFNSLIAKLNTNVETKILATRDYVRKNLTTPAEYYIKRGYSAETLKFFDVGLCIKRGQEMFMRVTVPVYDITGKYLIGCVGRSINPECVLCGRYHAINRACPTNMTEEKWSRKWINSSGFNTGNHLYNLWNAAELAKEKQRLVLVEGQGDVWRLHEAGIDNAVGLFGCKLTDNQFELIESLGITDIYVALDIDEEGLKARQKVIDRLSMYYNIHEISLTSKDVGDMSISDIHLNFKELI
jgi:5S rRNA maturation endonuclease (ribonuclease M5)